MKFNNLKIGVRLGIGFGILSVLLLVAIGISLINLAGLNSNVKDLAEDKFPKTVWANNIIDAINEIDRGVRNAFITDDPKITAETDERIREGAKIATESIKKLDETITTEKGKNLLEGISAARQEYYGARDNYYAALDSGDKESAKIILYSSLKDETRGYIDAIANLIQYQNELVDEAAAGAFEAYESAQLLLIGIGIGAFILAIIVGIWIIRSITKPVSQAVDAAKEIAKGNIKLNLKSDFKDETGQLINSMKVMADSIDEMIEDGKYVATEAMYGRLDSRADSSKHEGAFKDLIEGINETMNTVVGKFEAVPTPIQFMDKDFNIQYINQTGAKLLGKSKKELMGLKCSDVWKTTKCSTADCPCNQSMKKDSTIELMNDCTIDGKHLDIHCAAAPLKNKKGEIVGSFEFVSDQTEVTQAARKSEKISEYQVIEANKLVENLNKLSHGDLKFNAETAAADEDTRDVKEVFDKINSGLRVTVDTLTEFTDSMDRMEKEHDAGEIDFKIDSSKFSGVYNKMADGVNDLVQSHIDVKMRAMAVVSEYAKGNFDEIMEELPGKKAFIKETLDMVRQNLLNVVKELDKLNSASSNGKLGVRGDIEKFAGEYRNIVEGFNNTLDTITTPLHEAADVLSTMADGDLRVRMNGKYKGEFEEFKGNINELGESLESLIAQVVEASISVASSSEQISQIAGVLATSSQEQSAQSEEVASAVEEMAHTINENAENANKTSGVAEENGKIANDGGDVVKNTVQKMRDIASVVSNSTMSIEKLGESSKEIGEIISVIDDIADQTNLLALNAAIEAARAGDQGRGFAVVADEVRKLAERTTEATKQIEQMIKNIQRETQDAVQIMNNGNNEVNNGIELADKAGEALELIVRSTNEVLQMISQIAVASEEQSSTSEQIAKSVESISHVANDSTKQISEVAEATESMTNLTANLKTLISSFKINEVKAKAQKSNSGGNGHNGNSKGKNAEPSDHEEYSELMEVSDQ